MIYGGLSNKILIEHLVYLTKNLLTYGKITISIIRKGQPSPMPTSPQRSKKDSGYKYRKNDNLLKCAKCATVICLLNLIYITESSIYNLLITHILCCFGDSMLYSFFMLEHFISTSSVCCL
jgi:hypothetical protein